MSIILQNSATIFILLCFGVFSNINNFWMFIPNSFCAISKSLDNVFKTFFALNVIYIKIFDGFD